MAKFKPFERISFSLSVISRFEKLNTTLFGSMELSFFASEHSRNRLWSWIRWCWLNFLVFSRSDILFRWIKSIDDTSEARLECATVTCDDNTRLLACIAVISSFSNLFWHCRYVLEFRRRRLATLNHRNRGITECFLQLFRNSKSSLVFPSFSSRHWNFRKASMNQAGIVI
jgi:hypothetical protein